MSSEQKELIKTLNYSKQTKNTPKKDNVNNFRDGEILLSKVVTDQAEAFKFELLYVPNIKYVLTWKANTRDGEEDKIEMDSLSFEPLKVLETINKLSDGNELTNDDKIIKQLVLNGRFEPSITELLKNTDYISEDLKQEINGIIKQLFESLVNVSFYDEEDHLKNTNNNLMVNAILEAQEEVKKNTLSDTQKMLINNFTNNESVGLSRRLLGRYLNEKHGIIIRNDINTYYKVDDKLIGYNKVSFDDIRRLLREDLGKNIISKTDLEKALEEINEIKKPEHDKVKFNNCIYDMDLMEEVHLDKPVFTLTESKYNYNPKAESNILKEFLETSLYKGTPERTKEYIKGLLQLVGYCFTSGNPLTALIFIVGVGGGGKSVFTNILGEIFGVENIADLSLQDLDSTHGTSSLIDKQLNIVRDADDRTVEAEDTLKQLSGYDPIDVEPKFKGKYTIKREEVPTTIVVANTIPEFRKTSQSLLSRFVVVEFNIKFRGTKREDKKLMKKILSNPQEIEWLIYNGLEAYKEMLNNNEDFILRLNEKETKHLVEKYTNPVNYLVSSLIIKYDPEAGEFEDIVYTEKLNKLCVKLAKAKGIEIKTNKHNLIDGRVLNNAIKEEFDLFGSIDSDGNKYTTKVIKDNHISRRYYPNLIKDVEMWDEVENMEFNE